MAKPKLYFIIGTESSGTRLLEKIVESCKQPDDRVHRRSLPHFGVDNLKHSRRFVDVNKKLQEFVTAGYDVKFILTVRDISIVTQSKCREHLSKLGSKAMSVATSENERARSTMLEVWTNPALEKVLISYETLMFLGVPYLQQELQKIGLNPTDLPEFKDGNPKYLNP